MVSASITATVPLGWRSAIARTRFYFDGVDPAAPHQRTVRVAKQAHRFYSHLVRSYDRHGYNARVGRITQRQLNRAANAVADVIASIS